jgi:hypothetical protein
MAMLMPHSRASLPDLTPSGDGIFPAFVMISPFPPKLRKQIGFLLPAGPGVLLRPLPPKKLFFSFIL